MSELTIEVPTEWWLSSNKRDHRMEVARRTKYIRDYVRLVVVTSHLPRFDKVHVCAFIQYPTARKADPPNAWPTVKAILDGLTDAGVWPDDDSTHVVATEFRRDPGKSPAGTYRVRLVLTDQAVPFAEEVAS